MNFVPKINRRSFFIGTAAVGGGLALGLDFARRPQGGPRRGRLAGGRRLGRDPARRHRRHPHRPLRDGPGHADRPRPARRRGARMRLVEGHDRISDARRERRAQARLGRVLDRRQPRHPRVARICAQGRRGRAHDADPGRGQRVEGAGVGMHRVEQRRSRTRRPSRTHHLRQGRGSRRQARGAEGASRSRIRRTGRSPASR